MASFVEEATLLLNDRSTKDINRINKALSELFRTANRMRNMRVRLDVPQGDVSRLEAMQRALREFDQQRASMRRGGTIGLPRIDASQFANMRTAIQLLNRLNAAPRFRSSGAVPLISSRQLQSLRAIINQANDAEAAVRQI